MDHNTFMQAALNEAEKSLVGNEFPVGCVLVKDNEIVARGRRTNSFGPLANELDHAEIRALRDLNQRLGTAEMTGVTAYTTMEPCLMCFATLLLNNIHQLVYAYEDVMGGGTSLPRDASPPLFRNISVDIIPHVMRRESLSLFQEFFSRPDNAYWSDSSLARYTLAQ